MIEKPEILAPAGSFESVKAAVLAKADAIYLGGSKFGARAYATNFDEEQLLKAIDYAHIHGVRVYLTVNTLLKNQEIDQVIPYLLPFYKEGLDGVIVQDVGVARIIKQYLKDLPIHGSTQMTITGVDSALLMKKFGMTRVVPARELSFEEIRDIKEATNLELETFIHGALCYCYSGQCLFSSMLGGRSGNRGRCAQTCRLPYGTAEGKKKQYLLSPKDLSTISLIPQLVESKIDSFKIEGRMKSPEYVALVVSIYKHYLEKYLSGEKEYKVSKEDLVKLLDAFNRGGFTKGYYIQHNGTDMMSMKRPNHQGVYLGKVEKIQKNTITFTAKEKLNKQDVLEVLTKDTSKTIQLTSPVSKNKGEKVCLNANSLNQIKIGQEIYRTNNQELKKQVKYDILESQLKENIEGKVILKKDFPAILKLKHKMVEVEVEGGICTAAKNQPITKEKILAQMNKTGDSEFSFSSLTVEMTEELFMPIRELNQLRRKGLDTLSKELISQYKREEPIKDTKTLVSSKHAIKMGTNPKIVVKVLTLEQFYQATNMKEVSSIYVESSCVPFSKWQEVSLQGKEKGKKIYFVLPRIFRKETRKQYEQHKEQVFSKELDGLVVGNLDAFAYALGQKEYQGELVLDYTLYGYNQEAISYYEENCNQPITFTMPVELNCSELMSLSYGNSQLVVYGHLPLMVSAQCVRKNTSKCTKTEGFLSITDRYEKPFYVHTRCSDCYNVIYNGTPVSLLGEKERVSQLKPNSLRLDFTIESKEEVEEIIRKTGNVFLEGKQVEELASFTKGHFLKGIL